MGTQPTWLGYGQLARTYSVWEYLLTQTRLNRQEFVTRDYSFLLNTENYVAPTSVFKKNSKRNTVTVHATKMYAR